MKGRSSDVSIRMFREQPSLSSQLVRADSLIMVNHSAQAVFAFKGDVRRESRKMKLLNANIASLHCSVMYGNL